MALTTGTNAQNLHIWFEKKLLSVLEPRLRLFPLGMKQNLPGGNGKQVKWLRYSKVASSTTALTEATVPADIALPTYNVTATVDQYGQWVKISDMLADTAIDPVMKNSATRLGKAAAETIEDLIVAECDAGSAAVTGGIQRVNDRANDAAIVAGDVLSHLELIEAMIQQKNAYIGPHESGDYVAVLHPACEFDILSDQQAGSFLDINKYVGQGRSELLNGEIGRMYGMRLVVSDKMTTTVSTVSVKTNYMIGEEAFGVVNLKNGNIKSIIKMHGASGISDPLDQVASAGYKIHGFAAKYLSQSGQEDKPRLMQIRAASALP